jgi:hypothetical protein
MPPNTARWSQRRPTPKAFGAAPLEFMDGLSYRMIIEFAEPLARLSRRSFGAKRDRRGSPLDR